MDKLLYTPVEAARVLGIGRSKLYELLGTGELSSVRIGACRRISAQALRAFVAGLDEAQIEDWARPESSRRFGTCDRCPADQRRLRHTGRHIAEALAAVTADLVPNEAAKECRDEP